MFTVMVAGVFVAAALFGGYAHLVMEPQHLWFLA
jgi:hypothetical protein